MIHPIRNKCLRFAAVALLGLAIRSDVSAQNAKPALFQSDFQQVAAGSLPEDFKALSGEFVIKEEAGNRFVELSATPLNSFGLLLGPERESNTSIQARIRGWPAGKRFPEFGIGLGGAGGFALWLMPAINELQIRQSNRILSRAPLTWKPGTWTSLRLQLKFAGEGKWTVEGKAWNDGETEPAAWLTKFESTTAPLKGRSVLWGTPYSEKAIQFDNVLVEGD